MTVRLSAYRLDSRDVTGVSVDSSVGCLRHSRSNPRCAGSSASLKPLRGLTEAGDLRVVVLWCWRTG